MSDRVILTLSSAERADQLAARAEVRASCLAYLEAGPDRTTDVAEQIARAVLAYLDGEEEAGV